MRVFIAGATGVVGRSLTGMLVQAGHEVTGMTRSEQRAEGLRALGAEAVICDALDAEALRSAVMAARPEAVVHELTDLPADMHPRRYKTQLVGTNKLRTDGTRNLVSAARDASATRILAQSVAFAYEPSGGWVKDEDASLDLGARPPMDGAVAAIAALERLVLDAGGIVLRYGFFYGAGTHFAPGALYAQLVRKRQLPIVGSGDGRWSFVHAEDAAAATVAALERGSPGIYNIVDDDPARAADWIPAYAAAISAKRPMRVPMWLGRLVGGPVAVQGMTAQRGASNAKARRELGWVPQHASWRDGFRTAAD